MALGKTVAAKTAKAEAKSMGLMDSIVPTDWDTAHMRNPQVRAIDIVCRLSSLDFFTSESHDKIIHIVLVH